MVNLFELPGCTVISDRGRPNVFAGVLVRAAKSIYILFPVTSVDVSEGDTLETESNKSVSPCVMLDFVGVQMD